jgi:hypothetical protein
MLTALPAAAQVVREDNTKSIAGVLVPIAGDPLPFSEWTFRSPGGEILFASLDAEIYLPRIHEEPAGPTASACEDEGGPGLFYIAVIGPDGAEVCRAERPAPPPGWQRDPRLACLLPSMAKGKEATYTLRVGLLGTGEVPQAFYPFLLNVSLRGVPPSGMKIRDAIPRSRSQF